METTDFFETLNQVKWIWPHSCRPVLFTGHLSSAATLKPTRVERIPTFEIFRSEWHWWEFLRLYPFNQAQRFLWKIYFLTFLVILMPFFEENNVCYIVLKLFIKMLSEHKVLYYPIKSFMSLSEIISKISVQNWVKMASHCSFF